MTNARAAVGDSAFVEKGFKATIADLLEEIKWLYRADEIPWVVGYSGGKDSTATLQLVWLALEGLDPAERTKPVHVISTDTLVENPIVAAWVTRSLDSMHAAADDAELPITPHRLTPAVEDTFWVNLIGKGYPAPRPLFRWCTERMKIKPSNTFIHDVVRKSGEAIVVLGTRKAESAARSGRMKALEEDRPRDLLSPNLSLPNSLVYTPVADWSNDDVWMFLMQSPNPWGYDNRDLLTMYSGASADGECPLVIDTSTRSCGDSRFGCWTCTLVDKDKSMSAMIQNDDEKRWMQPLLELRDELDIPDDRHLRDFRRMSGKVQLFHDRTIPGPYTQTSREYWLRRLLEAQTWVRHNGPEEARDIELITMNELHEIRRIWVYDKHEIEDSLPSIYESATGDPFPGAPLDEHLPLGAPEIRILRDQCGEDRLRFEMTRELLDIERRFSGMARRAGLFEALTKAIRRHFYEDESDATEWARSKLGAKTEAEEQASIPVTIVSPKQVEAPS